jgi:hypothetical protein
MDFSSKFNIVIWLFSLTLIFNLFFGYLRRKTRKFSLKWFLCIHLPIPLVILGRIITNLDYRYIPIFLIAAVTGQILGGKLEF